MKMESTKVGVTTPTWLIFGAILILVSVCGIYFRFESEKESYPAIDDSENVPILEDPFSSERGMVQSIDSATVIFLKLDSCLKIIRYNRFVDSVLNLNRRKKEFGIRKIVTTIEGQPIYEWIIREKDSIKYVIDSRKDSYSGDKKIGRVLISSMKEKELSVQQCPDYKLKVILLVSDNKEEYYW